MNAGDWVFFKTRNWPKDVRITHVDAATGEQKDVTGQGLYQGRGKIVGIIGGNTTVLEEKTNRLMEIGLHPDDEICSLANEYARLTLGDLRAFLENYKDAPNDIPVTIALPVSFFSDEDDDVPPDHPEYKAVSASESVDASDIVFMGFSESGEIAEGFIPPEKRGGENWDFCIDLSPNSEQCYKVMREHEDE